MSELETQIVSYLEELRRTGAANCRGAAAYRAEIGHQSVADAACLQPELSRSRRKHDERFPLHSRRGSRGEIILLWKRHAEFEPYVVHRAWPQAEYVVVPDAGHSAREPGIARELVAATDRLRARLG